MNLPLVDAVTDDFDHLFFRSSASFFSGNIFRMIV